jgi:hypothetical protein
MDEDPLPFTFVDARWLGNTVDARYGYGILRTGMNKISPKVVSITIKPSNNSLKAFSLVTQCNQILGNQCPSRPSMPRLRTQANRQAQLFHLRTS